MIFNCCCLCCYLIFPNTFNVSEISKGIKDKLYRKYFSNFTKRFGIDLIYFTEKYQEDDKNNKIEVILTKKILKEINKLNISKYSFWNDHSTSFIVEQLSYYIFSLLINPDSLFEIKRLSNDLLHCIEFDFTNSNIDDFKKSFFCKKDGTIINLDTEKDKNIHESLNIKLTNKIRNITENIDFSIIIPLIINSYIEIKNNEEKNRKKEFGEII